MFRIFLPIPPNPYFYLLAAFPKIFYLRPGRFLLHLRYLPGSIVETDALCRQPVQRRRLYYRITVAPQCIFAVIVGNHQYNIYRFIARGA